MVLILGGMVLILGWPYFWNGLDSGVVLNLGWSYFWGAKWLVMLSTVKSPKLSRDTLHPVLTGIGKHISWLPSIQVMFPYM